MRQRQTNSHSPLPSSALSACSASNPVSSPRSPRLRGESSGFRGDRAFTLVELIVVIVLLGVVAGLAAPRLLSTGARRAEANMREVADLLGVAARRDASSGGQASDTQRLVFDAEKRTFALQVRRARTNARGETEDAGVWRPDPLASPVNLEQVRLTRTVVDGVAADDRGWTLDFVPGQLRPTVELVVEAGAASASSSRRTGASDARRWNLLLLPYASGAEIAELGATSATTRAGAAGSAQLRSVDLDAQGVGDRPW
ncbi:MAG: prepilin-type N-terminal cleavage/methylation domain-containing protein [Phycisphaerales bacterium]